MHRSHSATTEHFVTVFDTAFLPQGLRSIDRCNAWRENFILWVLATDGKVAGYLQRLALPNLTVVSALEMETAELGQVKPHRSRGEYCWTLTPFTFQVVFDRCPTAERATYLDADVYFFDSPWRLIEELVVAGRDVLITEHAYAGICDFGEPCTADSVQFTCRRTAAGVLEVVDWWKQPLPGAVLCTN